MTQFETSQTCLHLMRAFAGESQARNRYTFAAGQCRAKGLYVLERLFLFTAGQEKEHAELFYNRLAPLSGQNITLNAAYPVNLSDDPLALLRDAHHNEMQEYSQEYRQFAETARQEGFQEIAALFQMIASIEKTHADRFARFAALVEQNRLFSDSDGGAWLCLNCGHIHTGPQAPALCPVCSHEQGYFVRAGSPI